MSAQHIHFFFTLREQLKLYHWQTSSYARHKATDEVLGKLDELIDTFVEIYMGKYGRPRLTKATSVIEIKNLTEKTSIKFIKGALEYLNGPLTKSLRGTDTDLFNIRDEMLGELNKFLYLSTLE